MKVRCDQRALTALLGNRAMAAIQRRCLACNAPVHTHNNSALHTILFGFKKVGNCVVIRDVPRSVFLDDLELEVDGVMRRRFPLEDVVVSSGDVGRFGRLEDEAVRLVAQTLLGELGPEQLVRIDHVPKLFLPDSERLLRPVQLAIRDQLRPDADQLLLDAQLSPHEVSSAHFLALQRNKVSQ